MTNDKLARFGQLEVKRTTFELTPEEDLERDRLAYELVQELAEENERLRALVDLLEGDMNPQDLQELKARAVTGLE